MTLISSRYEILQPLGAGGMGEVWLAHDKLRGQQVALKQVLMSDDHQRLAITREFHTLSTLRHPNIVSVIEYGSHQGQPYFTMEYLPDAVPVNRAADRQIERFIQILQALGYLHRRGILHRDLKPANVLVTPQGLVKVLDFGLARGGYSTGDTRETIAGTVNYMAPEILKEEAPSAASDLWAVGVMMCEILTGHPPFEGKNPVKQVLSIVNNDPDLSGLDDNLVGVVSRLLNKNPHERYSSALAVVHDLCAAAGIDIPPESQALRESFLQAAAFVGREREYGRLVEALGAAKQGTRQVWLVGGEAGAGKSRLLDEVRARALVDGFVVLQGQAVESGGLPYALWRDPARKLVLGAPVNPLTASVLKALVPDIGALLEREVADLPALEARSQRDRLMAALLERLRALDAPVLILLEDLHWAGESLETLKLLVPHLDGLPVMVIGSYRNDEKPHLPEELPAATLLTMERLSPEALSALSASMIGEENATPELVNRLTNETEGNALFMVEVMRVLAEEAGSLHEISHKTLPEKIFAGGMVAVLRRRLEKVPAWALEPLKLAAVIGRRIDPAVLRAAGIDEVERWFITCADAAVLEPYQGEWRFSHDRLREVLLQDLTGLNTLHERAALAVEAVYPGNVSYAESLALHWRYAGNPEREVFYILKAAEYLVMISAEFARAETLLRRGLDLNLPDSQAELYLWLGKAAERQSRYADAESAYQTARQSSHNPELHASLLNWLSSVCRVQGKNAEAVEYANQAQSAAEGINDRYNIAVSLNMLGAVTFHQGDYSTARTHFENSMRIRQEIGDRHGTAASLTNLGTVIRYQRLYEEARPHLEQSLRLYREIGDRWGSAMAMLNLGGVVLDQGDNRAALAYFADSLVIQREVGNRWGTALSLLNLGNLKAAEGDYTGSCECFEESITIAREIGDRNGTASGAVNLGRVLIFLGDYDAAQNVIDEGLAIFRDLNGRLGAAIALDNLGVLAELRGDLAAARAYYEESLTICREIGDDENLVTAAVDLSVLLIDSDEHAFARETLIEALEIAYDHDIDAMLLQAARGAAFWAAFWAESPEQSARWIGYIYNQPDALVKDDPRVVKLAGKVRAALGDEAFDAALEAGRLMDIWAEIEDFSPRGG